jgi:hypothetical protein
VGGVRDEVLVIITIGPVRSAAALEWTSATMRNLARVRAAAADGTLPIRLPVDVADAFDGLLREWHSHAGRSETFHWSEEFDREWARHLVQYWANLDALSQEHAATLGLEWSPPEARPFFAALAAGVADALATDDDEPFSRFLTTRVHEPAPED